MLTLNKAPHSALVGEYPLRGEQVAWGLGPDLFDPGAGGFEGTNGVSNWAVYGTNTIEVSTDIAYGGIRSAKITYVDESRGANLLLQDAKDLWSALTIGAKYRVKMRAAVNAGSSVNIVVYDGITLHTAAVVTSTAMAPIVYDFIARNANNCDIRMAGMAAGEIIYLDDISIQRIEEGDVVVNGGFYTDTDWVKGTGWTIASGVATRTTPAAASNLQQTDVVKTGGQKYRATFTVSNYSTGTIKFYVGAGGVGAVRSANGTYIEDIFQLSDSAIYMVADADFAGDLDNISCQELYTPDMSGRANHGTVVDAIATPWGYDFNGTDEWIRLVGSGGLTAPEFTIMVKFTADTNGGSVRSLIGKQQEPRLILSSNTPHRIQVADMPDAAGGAGTDLNVAPAVATIGAGTTQWITLVMREGINATKIYLDERMVAQTTLAGPLAYWNASDWTFATYTDAGVNPLDGTIHKTLLFQRALTQQEILEEMRRLSHPSSLSLVA